MKTSIVIEMDADLKPLADAFLDLVVAVKGTRSQARGGCSLDYLAIESELAAGAAKIERAAHEAVLSSLIPKSDRIAVRGKTYCRIAMKNGCYRTQSGEVIIERPLYREVGRRNGEVVDPIALRVGSVGEGWLPGAVRAMSHLLQQGTSREAETTARELSRLPYSRSSFERIPHELGKLLAPHQAEIEEELIKEYMQPPESKSISVSIDRVSVPMEEAAKRPVGRPRKNAPKRPIERNFRMAYCGTVTLHDGEGKSLHTIRYGRMPLGDAVGLAEALAGDVMALLRGNPNLEVTLLADGAPEIWNLLEGQLDDGSLAKGPHRLIDFWHLLEKLSAAAKVIHTDDAKKVMKRWRKKLRGKPSAALHILAELRGSGMEGVRVSDADPVHDAITYLKNNHLRMNYAAALALGLPIGSGNVEATCKSLVATRMKRPGSRWKEDTGHRVMQLRAFALSDRWAPAMEKLFARHRVPIRSAA